MLRFINSAGFYLRTLIAEKREDGLIAIEIGLANSQFYLYEYTPYLNVKTFDSFFILMEYVRTKYGSHNLNEFRTLATTSLASHKNNMEKLNSWRKDHGRDKL